MVLTAHPEHAQEQEYIERADRAAQTTRERRERSPEFAPDKATARVLREREQALRSLGADPEKLCFGRIDLGDRAIYIGREMIRDADSKLLVSSWAADAVKPFYEATQTDPMGIQLRRRFQLDLLRLLAIHDDRFDGAREGDGAGVATATVTDDGTAAADRHFSDVILAEMDRARGSSMRDIVATIEAQQYALISDAIDGLLVIQGAPGSGKTAIALHRAAYLLYHHREELTRSGVLVVGPNRAFIEYVQQVLPSLGEQSVTQLPVDRLLDGSDQRVRATESLALARLKGDLRMADVIAHAVRARVRRPTEGTTIEVERTRVVLPAAEVGDLIDQAWSNRQTYNAARADFRRSLVDAVAQRIPASRGLFRGGPSSEAIATAITGPTGAADRIWPAVTPGEVVRDLLGSRARLKASAPQLTDEDRNRLYREAPRQLRDVPWTAADIALLDEAAVAIAGVPRLFGYVLVDEAQDLSPMQLRMVLRRSSMGRATLVGDIAQSTGPWRFPDWQELIDASGSESPTRIEHLKIGYRVPGQIMRLAGGLLPRVAPDLVAPTAVREGTEEPRFVQVGEAELYEELVRQAATRAERDRSVGVIAPLSRLDDARAAFARANIAIGDILTDGLSRQLTLLSPAQAKGLEFDHVVVLDPVGIAGDEEEWAFVYISLTRATRTLSIVYATQEPLEPDVVAPETPTSALASARRLGASIRDEIHDKTGRRPQRFWIYGDKDAPAYHADAVAVIRWEDGPSTWVDEQVSADDRARETIDGYPVVFGPDWIALKRPETASSATLPAPSPDAPVQPAAEPIPAGVAAQDGLEPAEPTAPVLGPRYTEALLQAKFLHPTQYRRGTNVPYLAHLQSVAALVLEDGGTEDEAIAALLHDAVEDNSPDVLDRIAAQFGNDVALIVAGCTDPLEEADASWRDRKVEHMRRLEFAGPSVRRVALAEKLDNARTLLRDYRRYGEQVWERMAVDRDELLWYVEQLADLFATERPGDMADELTATVERLLDLVSTP